MTSYTEQLAQRLSDAPPRRKGERTRARLELACAEVLARVGFHAMRISDITAAAGVSEGLFYSYFSDKRDISLAVLGGFLEALQDTGAFPSDLPREPFAVIRHTNLGWIRNVQANAGLMRCVFQLTDEEPEFGALVHATNRDWYERVARSVLRNHPAGAADPAAALFAACALGGMMDDLMRRLVVYPDAAFVDFLTTEAPGDEALAEALAVVWLRVLYPALAPPAGLAPLASALAALGQGGAEATAVRPRRPAGTRRRP
ncbi:MAG: TetR/AcrR family transcriptional regulator [Gammaproteobacteria bacterium]|nr:MAG: TetR/AcrR family transcriptional regulator [Gammaproteobacteria bacterium]